MSGAESEAIDRRLLPNGFLAMIDSSATNGSDSPSELTADTRNLYSFPGVRPVRSMSKENKIVVNLL